MHGPRGGKITSGSTKEIAANDEVPGGEDVNVTVLIAEAVANHQAGSLGEAERLYNIVLENDPSNFDALHLLGVISRQRGNPGDSVFLISKALAFNPSSASAHYNIGLALNDLERYEEALESYRTAIKINPRFAAAHNAQGSTLRTLKRFDEAFECYRTALDIKPDFCHALNNLGNILRDLGRVEESVPSLERAIELYPDYSEAYFNLALARNDLKQHEMAVECLWRVIELQPNHARALSRLAYIQRQVCDWRDFKSSIIRLEQFVEKDASDIFPFALLSMSDKPNLQARCARQHSEKLLNPEVLRSVERKKLDGDRIRLGYLSSDFRLHALALLMAELFEIHDRQQFDVIGFSLGPDDSSPMRRRLMNAFDHFVDLRGHSDREAAQMMADMGIDIAIDLNGYTRESRPGILAHRPAPIQVNYLGYPGTMGADFIDYIIADPFVVPAEQQCYFTEKLVHLPDCYQVNDRSRMIAQEVPLRCKLGLPENGFVFCCFNNSYKLTPDMFDIWMRLLQAVPGSVLWLIGDSETAIANLCREASVRGVAPDRLVFAERANYADYLARYQSADLFLDTLPYNAGTTASDALWAGLPVLTCAGNTFVSRMAGSLLNAVGLPELVTDSLADYENLALRLAREPEILSSAREKLKLNRDTAPLFDSDRFRYHIEVAFKEMWRIHESGRAPQMIVVPCLSGPVPSTCATSRSDKRASMTCATDLDISAEKANDGRLFYELQHAVSLREQGKLEEARIVCETILKNSSDHFDTLHLLGVIRAQQGDYRDAVLWFEKALELNLNTIEIHFNLAKALVKLERLNEAEAHYSRALEIRPDFAEAHNQLGSVLYSLKRFGDAANHYRKALDLQPDHLMWTYQLGSALMLDKDYQGAISCFRTILGSRADHSFALSALARSLRKICDWSDFDEMQAQLTASVTRQRLVSPFGVLTACDDLEIQQKSAVIYVKERISVDPGDIRRKPREDRSRLRLGYLSADFRRHVLSRLMAELFEIHDRDRFEVIAFSFGPDDGSSVRRRLERAFDQFVDVRTRSDLEVAQLMADMGIDIAIDLMGYTTECRPTILAYRPAPVQVNYLGYPGTMGANFIDYIVADPFVVPADKQSFFTEKLVHLPDCYQVNDQHRSISENALTRTDCGLPKNGFVFCCFNNSYKLTPGVFDIWMRLLDAVNGSVLWLVADNESSIGNLRREAENRGVSSDRIVFAKRSHYTDYLASYRLADLFLDTLPYNAGATASDALWAGLPVLTCAGNTFVGRMAGSLLNAVGLPELVTENLEDYEALALKLAREPDLLTSLRERLAANRDTAPLFDTNRFRSHIESAYQKMWSIYRRGDEPQMIVVPRQDESEYRAIRKRKQQAPVISGATGTSRTSNDQERLAQLNLAVTLREQGRISEAKAICEAIIREDTEHFDALHLQGVLHAQQGAFQRAVEVFKVARALRDDVPDLHHNLGNALSQQNRFDEAVHSYQRAISLEPGSINAYRALAKISMRMNRAKEGIDYYRRLVELNPLSAEDHYALGNAFMSQRRYREAVLSFKHALRLRPDFVEAHNNCGNALGKLTNYKEALNCYESALKLNPDYPAAHVNIASVLMDVRRFSDAIAHLKMAQELGTSLDAATAALPILVRQICDWQSSDFAGYGNPGDFQRRGQISDPFVGLALSINPVEQRDIAERYVKEKIQADPKRIFASPREEHNRLRLAYLSVDFRQHALARLMAELFEIHDRKNFEVIAFSLGPDDGSSMRRRLERAFDQFLDVREKSDYEVAQLMEDMGIDIAIDLGGYTRNARPGILAYRPAPIQVNYLGYPGTMGANFIDYILVDPFVVPSEHQSHYTERLVHLPDCYQVNDRYRDIAESTPSRSEVGLPERGFVFCCFNNSYKLTPEMFDLWMRLLDAVPESALWLVADNETAVANLNREAENRGVSSDRIVFAKRSHYTDYLASYRLADLFLDTLPYNAGATASDALWAGLPVLTCAGNTFVGRMAGSLLNAVGLPELVTENLEDYEALALKLAREPDLLISLRERLAANRDTAPLFDTNRFRRHVEAAYREMWAIYKGGDVPRPITVAPQ